MGKLQESYDAAVERLHHAPINGLHMEAEIYNRVVETLHRLITGV